MAWLCSRNWKPGKYMYVLCKTVFLYTTFEQNTTGTSQIKKKFNANLLWFVSCALIYSYMLSMQTNAYKCITVSSIHVLTLDTFRPFVWSSSGK